MDTALITAAIAFSTYGTIRAVDWYVGPWLMRWLERRRKVRIDPRALAELIDEASPSGFLRFLEGVDAKDRDLVRSLTAPLRRDRQMRAEYQARARAKSAE